MLRHGVCVVLLCLLVRGGVAESALTTETINMAKKVWSRLVETPEVESEIGAAILKAMKSQDKDVAARLEESLKNSEVVKFVGRNYVRSFSLLVAGLEKGEEAIKEIRRVLSSEIKESFTSQNIEVDFPATTNNFVKEKMGASLKPGEAEAFSQVMAAFGQ